MEDERLQAMYLAVEVWARELVLAVLRRELRLILAEALQEDSRGYR